jgi:hypothetical protein
MHTLVSIFVVIVVGFSAANLAAAKDRHEGYYYPKVSSAEVYNARSKVMKKMSREARIGFVVAQTIGQKDQPYPPRFAVFAKGAEAEKMIIVGLDGESMATLYRARAVLAQLTAVARSSELFRNRAVEDVFTFLDLANMVGFKRVTITDGKTYAHQFTIK